MTTTYLAYIPSPSQGVWHIGPVPLRAYALFIIVGIIAALVIGDRRWVARGGQQGVIYDIALWAVPFGLIGGRLYHVMTDWRTYFGDDGAGLAGALRIWDGGLGIWGAVAVGAVGAWIGCREKGIPLSAFGDAIAPGIILAQAIGRLGNYFNQELYGRPTTLPWGLEIYERRDASGALDTLNGVSTGQLIEVVHPTFLYELLWNLLVFAALIWIDRRFKIGHGRLFAMYVAGYCVGRFWVELMRSDVATHIAGIRINSFTSTFVFIGAVVYIMVAPKGREDPASLAGKPEAVSDDHAVLAKELTAVAATTGVVAAAKAAGDAEAEDAAAAGDDAEEPEAVDAEALGADVAGVPAEALGADVAGVPADTVEDAEKFAAEGEEPAGGVGAVEGEEVADAVEAAPEVHEAEVAAAEEAELVADEAEAQPPAEAEGGLGAVEGEEVADAVEAAPEVHEAEVAVADEAGAVADEAEAQPPAEVEGGLGAVEGEEVADAVEAAPEVHEAEVAAVDEAGTVADEAEVEPPAEAEGGLGAVEGEEVADAVEAAPEVHEAEVAAVD
ncbi:prolipoprotein diacylglyceryl transferase, partial [Mycobacterium sp. NPDC048908]|uniref:prolipoprotein diacylglyceryl transferase n=1 Tax=Mycobacterium sp. NPDC048908 TaxID=3364292 RepID=UPI00371A1110